MERADAEGTHHLVVFVLYDMAMPDKLARGVESHPQAGHLARVGDDSILEAGLPSRITSYNVCYTKLLRMISAAARAASVALDTAKPQSAFFKAGASLTPSPVMETMCPPSYNFV